MRKMWVQFAKTGNPSLSAEISPDGKAKEWPQYGVKESEKGILDWERTYFLTKYFCI